jgi:hypothetical protein
MQSSSFIWMQCQDNPRHTEGEYGAGTELQLPFMQEQDAKLPCALFRPRLRIRNRKAGGRRTWLGLSDQRSVPPN